MKYNGGGGEMKNKIKLNKDIRHVIKLKHDSLKNYVEININDHCFLSAEVFFICFQIEKIDLFRMGL